MRRIARWLAAGAGLGVLGLGVALATIDHWLLLALHPGQFDPADAPVPPDYAEAAAWAARPGVPSGADAALPQLPRALPDKAPAAAFYLHPTTSVGRTWNAPIDDPAVVQATERGATLIQASVFNGCCAVYAPRYRQANGVAFTHPSPEGERAIEIALDDVTRAFDAFLAEIGERPFFVGGHSQGSALGARLLQRRVAGTPLQERLIAAYLPGTDLRPGDVDLPVCETAIQTGCIAAWNARGPRYRPTRLDYDGGNPDTMAGRICVNPITWRADEVPAAAEAQQGAVFFDTAEPALLPAFASAQCRDGTLVVDQIGPMERDLPSRVLLWITGPENYHPVEYQLFYADIRANILRRLIVRGF